jgi:hypothetical protein
VGGVVGGAVGGVFGGVAGGVKGVLGIPQSTATTGSRPQSASRSGAMSRSAIRAELVGRPLNWRSDDGSQSGVTVFYSDNTVALSKSSLKSGPEDAGRWTMRGNRTCVTWEKINPGIENCSTCTRTGPKTFRDSDGITFSTN